MKVFNKRIDWVGALAAGFGAAVVIPSLLALLVTIWTVVSELL